MWCLTLRINLLGPRAPRRWVDGISECVREGVSAEVHVWVRGPDKADCPLRSVGGPQPEQNKKRKGEFALRPAACTGIRPPALGLGILPSAPRILRPLDLGWNVPQRPLGLQLAHSRS